MLRVFLLDMSCEFCPYIIYICNKYSTYIIYELCVFFFRFFYQHAGFIYAHVINEVVSSLFLCYKLAIYVILTSCPFLQS